MYFIVTQALSRNHVWVHVHVRAVCLQGLFRVLEVPFVPIPYSGTPPKQYP